MEVLLLISLCIVSSYSKRCLHLLTKQTVFVRHQCNVYVMQIRNKNAKIYTVQIHFHQN